MSDEVGVLRVAIREAKIRKVGYSTEEFLQLT